MRRKAVAKGVAGCRLRDPCLRHRLPNRRALGGRFAFILASSTISGLGDGVVYVALPLLAAQLTRDPAAISLLSAASAIPALAGGLFAGALVDRWSKPVVLFNIAMLQSLLCAAFAVWMQRQQVGLADLFAVGFVFATVAMFAAPAFTAFLPTLVPSEGLEKANSALSMGQALTMQLVGLPLGGLLATLSMELPWTVDALSFAIEGLLLFAVGRSARGRVDTAPLRRGLRELGTEVRQGLRDPGGHRGRPRHGGNRHGALRVRGAAAERDRIRRPSRHTGGRVHGGCGGSATAAAAVRDRGEHDRRDFPDELRNDTPRCVLLDFPVGARDQCGRFRIHGVGRRFHHDEPADHR